MTPEGFQGGEGKEPSTTMEGGGDVVRSGEVLEAGAPGGGAAGKPRQTGPQSRQSVAYAHSLKSAPGPPSSHTPSPEYSGFPTHELLQVHPGGTGGIEGEGPQTGPQSRQSVAYAHSL